MKKFFNDIWTKLKQFWAWIRWITRKPIKRQYVVTECLTMPSLIGMKCYGRPVVNQMKMFVGGKDSGFRSITPAHIDRVRDGEGDLEIYTKYLHFYADRIY